LKLVVIGDSWASGHIIGSDKPDLPDSYEYSFAHTLGKISNTIDEVENLSCRGRNQQYISWRLHRYANTNNLSNTAFLFVFSSAVRLGMPFTNYHSRKTPIYFPYKSEHEIGIENFDQAEHENEIHKHGIEMLCKKLRVKFAFIDAFENTSRNSIIKTQTEYYLNANKPNNTLADIILQRYCKPGEETAVDLLRKNAANNPYIAPCFHPSIEGHKYIAYKLKDIIDAKFS
jgi:hypothetical protein